MNGGRQPINRMRGDSDNGLEREGEAGTGCALRFHLKLRLLLHFSPATSRRQTRPEASSLDQHRAE